VVGFREVEQLLQERRLLVQRRLLSVSGWVRVEGLGFRLVGVLSL